MPAKRAPKASVEPTALSPAKKSERPASTKKKQAPQKYSLDNKDDIKVTKRLNSLLENQSATAQSIVDFIVGPACGLESVHRREYSKTRPVLYFSNVTAFLMAVAEGRLDVAKLLVAEHSVNTKVVDEQEQTALHIASVLGRVEMVQYLVEHCGLDIQAVDKFGNTPLFTATNRSQSTVALLLLELGADPTVPDSYQKLTPLHLACIQGLTDVVRHLIAKGVDINTVDSEGRSPLHLAIANHRCDTPLLLLELGADPNLPDNSKSTPLHLARENGLVDVARKLIEKGASQSAVNNTGNAPLDLDCVLTKSDLAALFGAK